ncbi:hypothetical protein M0534_08480 [Methylonatrum kenyense]|uniref:hypothetical protein n=1 Tax=Methylonatrum kenyense TaxID=455253 RepID=UPI0020BF54EA|nr:hypothetical protein [Methylonatrum kenyense]MCK8516360.1 hypothetical protein [Methylonatrum kenyense]
MTPADPPKITARKRRSLRALLQTEIPLAVYCVIFFTMVILWIIQEVHPDITLGLLTELMGAAFTLFIIDTLLVRSKTRRWRVVQEHVDYLIARNVNRLRDGIAVRAFGFNPSIALDRPDANQHQAVREQRADLLSGIAALPAEAIMARLAESALFADDTYAYLNERADDLWDVLNMKYSEYMAPGLVSDLMRLHTHLKDLCGHLRQYGRAERFPEAAGYYQRIGRLGASVSVREIVILVNALKEQGYSEPAALADSPDAERGSG